MKTLKSITGAVVTILIAATISFFASSACTQNTPFQSQTPTVPIDQCVDTVIAKVGSTDITFGDLLKVPQVYYFLHESLIKPVILQEEATKRGIVITPEELDQKVADLYASAGGEEAILSQVPASVPKELIADDLRRTVLVNTLTEKIMESLYDSEHGPATEEEIQKVWDENGDYYRNLVNSDDASIAPADVTIDMAREKITADLKMRWQNENGQTAMKDLIDSYDVQNILLDTMVGPQPEVDETTVPVLTPPEQTGSTVGEEPVQEEGGEEGAADDSSVNGDEAEQPSGE